MSPCIGGMSASPHEHSSSTQTLPKQKEMPHIPTKFIMSSMSDAQSDLKIFAWEYPDLWDPLYPTKYSKGPAIGAQIPRAQHSPELPAAVPPHAGMNTWENWAGHWFCVTSCCDTLHQTLGKSKGNNQVLWLVWAHWCCRQDAVNSGHNSGGFSALLSHRPFICQGLYSAYPQYMQSKWW